MTTRKEVEFDVDGGVRLRGWLFIPRLAPALALRSPWLTALLASKNIAWKPMQRCSRIVDSSFSYTTTAILARATDTPRNDIDPWQQVADWRRAISFLESQDCVNSQKIGLWGSSFAGGHAIVLGPPIGACAVSWRRCQQSADTSRV